MARHRKPLSKCTIVGDVVEVELINTEKVAICDIDDYEYVSKHRWRMNGSGYAITYQNYKALGMHRALSDCPDGLEVDHIDRDRLNNRKANLRLCTRHQNSLNTGLSKTNTSGYKGVRKHGNGWQAYIMLNRKTKLLGTYKNIDDACNARKKAEKIYHSPLIEKMQSII